MLSTFPAGYAKVDLRAALKSGPVTFFKDRLDEGAMKLEAYWSTVNKFAEAVYVGRGFALFDGYYEATGLSSASGQADLPITAPSADTDEDNTSVFEVC